MITCAAPQALINILFYTVQFFMNVILGALAAKYVDDSAKALHDLTFYIDAYHKHLGLPMMPSGGLADQPGRGLQQSADWRSVGHGGSAAVAVVEQCDDQGGSVNTALVKFTRGLAEHVERDQGPSLFDMVAISPNSLIAMFVYVVATGVSLFYKQMFHVS
jgi:hypothetical protein